MNRPLWTTLVAATLAAPLAHAGETWTFDVTTTGQDVSWNSPTSVDPAASVYAVEYLISLVEVDVTWNGIPFNNIDVTNQVPPELQSDTVEVVGPAPVSAINQSIVVPPPPEPVAFSANLSMGLDAGGFGFASATNVTLGTLTVNLPIFGNQLVTLTSVRLAGQLTIHGAWYDLGSGLAGTTGVPLFIGSGPLKGGTALTLTLANAAPSSAGILVVGVSQLDAPFFGGTMVPALDIILPIATNVSGDLVLPAVWPSGLPPGVSIYMQCWVINSTNTGVNGGSNGLRAVGQ